MLEIQEKKTAEGYEELAAYADCDSLHITEAFDKGIVTGYIAYSYETEKTVIYGYDDGGDLYLCDGLVRSVLYKSCLKGISAAEFRMCDDSKLVNLVKLGFVKDGNLLLENIDSLMNGCQNCKNAAKQDNS